jgi:hypothetical protein
MGAETKNLEPRLSISKSGLPSDTTVKVLNYRG